MTDDLESGALLSMDSSQTPLLIVANKIDKLNQSTLQYLQGACENHLFVVSVNLHIFLSDSLLFFLLANSRPDQVDGKGNRSMSFSPRYN